MKKIIFGLFIVGSFLFSSTTALSLSNTLLEVGSTVDIFGEGFGRSVGKYGGICFNTNSYCFLDDSDGIVLRSDNLIKIKIPGNISLKGSILIYVNNFLKGTLEYAIKPNIIDISNGNYIKKFGGVGEKILIQGGGFGDSPGNVFFDGYKANIVSRSNNQIWLNLPDVSNITRFFKIKNNAGLYSENRMFDIYPKLTNDEYSANQEYLSVINVKDVWNSPTYTKKGEGVIVAILDIGVKINHPDLVDSIWVNTKEIPNNGKDDDGNGYIDDVNGRNFVEKNNNITWQGDHGTMIAGIIAAKRNNGIGIAGISPKAKIMPLVIFDKGGKNVYDVGKAIRYAVDNGAKIINLSFGSEGASHYTKDFDSYFDYAYKKGVVIMAAAGNTLKEDNDSQNLDLHPVSPVCNDGGDGLNYVIGVTATDNNKIKASFADFGSKCVDISAPGVGIFSTSDKNYNSGNIDYDRQNGTSFATPIVAGAAALLWSNKPYLKNSDIYNAIIKHGDDIDLLNTKFAGKIGRFLNIKKLLDFDLKLDLKNNTGTVYNTGIVVSKKSLALFLSVKSYIKNYTPIRKRRMYQSILNLLKDMETKPEQKKNLDLIHGLIFLIEKEMNIKN